jgi:hypothetical protein
MRVNTALEVAPELFLHRFRQELARASAGVLEAALQVLLDDAIEEGLLRAALLVPLRCGFGLDARGSAMSKPAQPSGIRQAFSFIQLGERQCAPWQAIGVRRPLWGEDAEIPRVATRLSRVPLYCLDAIQLNRGGQAAM